MDADARRQGICSHQINLVCSKYSGFKTRRVNILRQERMAYFFKYFIMYSSLRKALIWIRIYKHLERSFTYIKHIVIILVNIWHCCSICNVSNLYQIYFITVLYFSKIQIIYQFDSICNHTSTQHNSLCLTSNGMVIYMIYIYIWTLTESSLVQMLICVHSTGSNSSISSIGLFGSYSSNLFWIHLRMSYVRWLPFLGTRVHNNLTIMNSYSIKICILL